MVGFTTSSCLEHSDFPGSIEDDQDLLDAHSLWTVRSSTCHKNNRIPIVCSTCELIVHQQENVRVRVDQIRRKITINQVHNKFKWTKGLSPNVSSPHTVTFVVEMCDTLLNYCSQLLGITSLLLNSSGSMFTSHPLIHLHFASIIDV